jgi:tetratricopeptide (TPR) repeat protein
MNQNTISIKRMKIVIETALKIFLCVSVIWDVKFTPLRLLSLRKVPDRMNWDNSRICFCFKYFYSISGRTEKFMFSRRFLDVFESAIKGDPQSHILRFLAGEAQLKLGERERAEMQFAAAIPPLGTRVLKDEALVAGFAALRLHDYDRANYIFSKIHGADPNNKAAWYGVQIARDRGRVPDAISYPEVVDVAGFPVPLHEIAGIRSYTPVKGAEKGTERHFIMPGHSRTIDACEEGLVYHTPVQRSVDSGYRIVKGDLGYFYDHGRDSLSGPYIATSAPQFAQLPPDFRSERGSERTKNGLAIFLTAKGSVEIVRNASKILDALGLELEKTHTGEIYLADPVLEGEHAMRFSRLINKSKAGSSRYKPGDYVMIVDGDLKGQRARVKEIDEEMDKIVVELDGVLLPVPIPLRLQQVSKARQ